MGIEMKIISEGNGNRIEIYHALFSLDRRRFVAPFIPTTRQHNTTGKMGIKKPFPQIRILCGNVSSNAFD